MTVTEAGHRCRNRAIEWLTTCMMLGIAVSIAVTPQTVARGSFRYLLELGLTPAGLAVFFFLVGIARALALYLNGRWHPYGPRLRAGGALFGAMIWALMALALAYLTFETGTVSVGVPVYACLAGAEIYSCLRAGADEQCHARG